MPAPPHARPWQVTLQPLLATGTGIAIFEAPNEEEARRIVADEPVTSGGFMRGDLRPCQLGPAVRP